MAQRFEGKNLDEALEAAGSALGVERYQLTYRVLTEKRGFLGGVKRVVVEAEVNESAPPVHEQTSFQVAAAPARQRRDGGESRARGGRGGRGERERGGRRGHDRQSGDRGGRSRGFRPDDRPTVEVLSAPIEAPEQGEQSAFARDVTSWFEEIFRLSHLEIVPRSTETADVVNVQLYGRDARKLMERNGELLDAIQVIANKSFGRREGAKSIECDTASYKELRTADLEERARRIAEQVRRDGREQTLPAMSPIERRIVHLALSDDAEVTTESRGDGFFKRVAIVPRAQTQTES